ncbi:MAG: biotin--[acetyl-CoA-carboxylase] ligase [Bacteroidetes bacterium]|nr:biotin--[acetyl-CoA-carboxylase] ligase [bacterium]NBP64538.1 biotin--[acetyl-CoA-carboxylase] ligase [Bacteroidota bacterium]
MKSFHYDIVDSTNSVAKELLKSHDEVIVTADEQTSGRGRNGHMWESGIGTDILFTYAIKSSPYTIKQPLMYQACAALAVQAFLLEILPKEADIALKYPNDVYVRFNNNIGKISGSLIEVEYMGNQLSSIITGIGINVNSNPFHISEYAYSMSIAHIMSNPLNLNDMYDLFIKKFLWFIAQDERGSIEKWVSALNLTGKKILHVQSEMEYTVQGLTQEGFLNCSREDHVVTIHSGDSVQYDLF